MLRDVLCLFKEISSSIISTANITFLTGKFVFNVIPEIKSQISYYNGIIEDLFKPFNAANTVDLSSKALLEDQVSLQYSSIDKYFFINKRYIPALYSLFPGVDSKKILAFMIHFNLLTMYLNCICCFEQIKDEFTLHRLYLSMFEAVDPDTEITDYYNELQISYINYHKYFPKYSEFFDDSEKSCLHYFVNSCRLQLKDIPSYGLVKEYIKKYIYAKVDYFIYKHSSNKNQTSGCKEDRENLFNWANPYLKQYTNIYSWEFQAAASSNVGLFALLALAFNPDLKEDTVANIDKMYFPWINGLQSLLENYINLYNEILPSCIKLDSTFTKNIFYYDYNYYNYSNYYNNLKECEERLIYFYEHALELCKTFSTSDSSLGAINTIFIKLIFIIYISDSKAYLGLKRISTRNLLSITKAPSVTFFRILMSTLLSTEYDCAEPY